MAESTPTTDVDPVTIEILNNRLHQIAREAGATLTRTAASPVTVEAKDLGFNVTTPTGDNVVFSVWMPRHGTTLSHMVKSTIDQFGLDAVEPGDMFLTNDPYAGALHIMDLAVLAPVHHGSELIAWTGCATHHLDVGAMTAGWPSRSRDWYQEGVKYPPVKVMEAGEVRDDIFELFLRNVRMPEYQGLDLKAQIAANTVSRRRIRDTSDEYGRDALTGTYDEMIKYSEATARDVIGGLPDGQYRHVDYLDYDALHRLECTLTVDGDAMTFDFTGTAEQAPSFVNCAYPCAEANLHNAIQTVLFPEATVNAGTFEPISVEIPEGTIFNCTPPNPCGGASIYAGWRVMSLTIATLSKAIVESSDSARASAEWGGGMPNIQLTGENRDGSPFTLMMTDSPMLGGGARFDKDGVNAANVLGSTNTTSPNVEYHEQRYPIYYLKRGLRAGSGGHGKYRGGLGGEFAFTVYGVEELDANPFQHRRDSLPFGLFGGYPGQSGAIEFHDLDTVDHEAMTIANRQPDRVFAQRNDEITISPGQVIHVKCAGGGAIGDPLTRDLGHLAADLAEEVIDSTQAAEQYGIVFDIDPDDGMDIDADATNDRRTELREERATEAESTGEQRERPCPACGGTVFVRFLAPLDVGFEVQADAVELERHVCSGCLDLVEVRVTVAGKPW